MRAADGTPADGVAPTAAGLAIRAACVDDAPELARLSTLLGYPTEAEPMRLRLRSLAALDGHRVCVAVTGAGVLCGWIHVARYLALEAGPYAEILGLVVDAQARRSGAGRRLIAEAERWSREQGLECIVVRSNVTRSESHLFYPSVGYARVKSQHVYARTLVRAGGGSCAPAVAD